MEYQTHSTIGEKRDAFGLGSSSKRQKGWFDAGVACVGMGSKLVRKDLIAAEDWKGITVLTSQCLAWIRRARGQAD